jgi:hypothetical protein
VCKGGLILSLKSQEEQCLYAERNRRKEQKVKKPFEVSELTKLRRESIFIMQVRLKFARLVGEIEGRDLRQFRNLPSLGESERARKE